MPRKKNSPAGTGKKRHATDRRAGRPGAAEVYTLAVRLLGGPVVSRAIEVRGDQTLATLHGAICEAFGHEGDAAYQFQRGNGPTDPEGPRYVLPDAYEISADDGMPAAGRVDQTTLAAVGLEVGGRFYYWIDRGADWWHQVDVEKIVAKIPRGAYPKVIRRVGPDPAGESAAGTGPAAGNREAADAACLVAELHLRKGEFRKAVEAFTRAIEEGPTPDAYEGRAKAYRALAAEDERASRAGLDISNPVKRSSV
jgi:hypothetical protein